MDYYGCVSGVFQHNVPPKNLHVRFVQPPTEGGAAHLACVRRWGRVPIGINIKYFRFATGVAGPSGSRKIIFLTGFASESGKTSEKRMVCEGVARTLMRMGRVLHAVRTRGMRRRERHLQAHMAMGVQTCNTPLRRVWAHG